MLGIKRYQQESLEKTKGSPSNGRLFSAITEQETKEIANYKILVDFVKEVTKEDTQENRLSLIRELQYQHLKSHFETGKCPRCAGKAYEEKKLRFVTKDTFHPGDRDREDRARIGKTH